MNNKKVGIVILALILTLGGYLVLNTRGTETPSYEKSVRYAESTTLPELFVASDEEIVLVGDAPLTVSGDLILEGGIRCEDGGAGLIVGGNAVISGTISCDLKVDAESTGIAFVLEGNVQISESAIFETNGAIQFVDSVNLLAQSPAELDQLYDSVLIDSRDGPQLGPFVDEVGEEPLSYVSESITIAYPGLLGVFSAKQAHAQGVGPVISGKIRFKNPPPKGVKQIIVFNFPTAPGLQISNFELSGPPGRNGTDDKGGSCNARGTKGEDAFRFLAFAPNLTVNNFSLNLGDGGDGGDAETGTDCDPGIARAGEGGGSGNFKMIAGEKFEITGAFNIAPGNGGNGGSATAHGKDGDASENGGDARATGGKGSDNKKTLRVIGSIAGASNVTVGDLVAGAGGFASANPGAGGAGASCGDEGGNGGGGNATGGNGGDAKMTLGGGAMRAALASDIGGAGATADIAGGEGGAGGTCDATGPGGDGGDGGSVTAKEGKGGSGDSGNAGDGIVIDETGGNGGNGGDGCLPGDGGSLGTGDPDGKDGKDGKNLCIIEKEEKPRTSLPPQKDTESVIQYLDYYITIDQLHISPAESDGGCPGDHWHPDNGAVMVTAGMSLPDPNPNGCGFGETANTPVIEHSVAEF